MTNTRMNRFPLWEIRLGWALLVFVGVIFALRGYKHSVATFQSRDFKPVYAGAACLISHCNPYNNVDLQRQFITHGGDLSDPTPFTPHYLGYPPDALFLIIPFTFVNWHLAELIWLAIIIGVFLLGTIAMGDLCMPYSPIAAIAAMSFMVLSNLLIVGLGQPTALITGLLLIAVWCFVRHRYEAIGVLCFAISLVFKPHTGAFILLYFFLAKASYRKKVWQVLGLTVLLAAPGLLWASVMPGSHKWASDLSTNLSAIASNGNFSDPGPSNLQAHRLSNLQSVFALAYNNPHFYNYATYLTCFALLLLWLYPVVHLVDGEQKDFLCLAAISALAMLPFYHRLYDTRLLLIGFPAIALLLYKKKLVGVVMLLISIVVTALCCGASLDAYLDFLYRPVALGCTLAFVAFLVCCYMTLLEEKKLAARVR